MSAPTRPAHSDHECVQMIPAWKRRLDVCVAAPACLALPVVFLLLLVITQLTSPGPIIYRQERIGLRGRRFSCLKFRTMHVGCGPGVHEKHVDHLFSSDVPMIKMDLHGDRRLIPMGRLLRATGLDELPQLINVLRGEMSIVGPRPCLPYEYPKFGHEERARFDTLPGLTGLWQVSGKNRTTFREMLALDLRYTREVSLALDVWIILRTPWVLLRQVIDARLSRARSVAGEGQAGTRPAPSRPTTG